MPGSKALPPNTRANSCEARSASLKPSSAAISRECASNRGASTGVGSTADHVAPCTWRGKTRLSGALSFEGEGPDVGGRVIRIVGAKQTYEARTDAAGVYEIYDLPPGEYQARYDSEAGHAESKFTVPDHSSVTLVPKKPDAKEAQEPDGEGG